VTTRFWQAGVNHSADADEQVAVNSVSSKQRVGSVAPRECERPHDWVSEDAMEAGSKGASPSQLTETETP